MKAPRDSYIAGENIIEQVPIRNTKIERRVEREIDDGNSLPQYIDYYLFDISSIWLKLLPSLLKTRF